MENLATPLSKNPGYLAALENAQSYQLIEVPFQPEIIKPNTASQDFLSLNNILIILGILGAVGFGIYLKKRYDKKKNESQNMYPN